MVAGRGCKIMVRVRLAEVDDLAAKLNEIAGDWDLFAGQLGVSHGKRKQIAANNAGRPNYAALCLVDALYCWVESSDNPTYEDIVDSLTKPESFVISRRLAERIIENYGLKALKQTTKLRKAPSVNKMKRTCHKISSLFIVPSKKMKRFFIVSLLLTVLFIISMYWGQLGNSVSEGTLSTAQHNLPYLPGAFIGRDKVLQDITQLLLDHRNSHVNTIAIYGPPLVGKSALAIHVGYKLVEQGVDIEYIDGVQRINTDRDEYEPRKAVTEESEIDHDMKHRFSFSVYSPEKKRYISHSDRFISRWVKNLKNETLLIFDNCDSVLYDQTDFQDFKEFLIKLGSSASKLRILTTSRLQLTLPEGFHAFPLSSLDKISATNLLISESRIELSHQDSESICELVGNVPHALIIVARLISEDSPASEIIAKLKESPIEVLSEDENDFVAAFYASYIHLDKRTKACGHVLSFFKSSFDSEVALIMCNITDSDHSALKQLVQYSMIESYSEGGQKLYALRHLMREFFRYIAKKRTTEDAVLVHEITAIERVFNETFISYYLHKFTYTVKQCENGCNEEDYASLRSERHNYRLLVDMMADRCRVFFTDLVRMVSASNVIFELFAEREQAANIETALKCFDQQLTAPPVSLIKINQSLQMYKVLIDTTKKVSKYCPAISAQRRKALDKLFSEVTNVPRTEYLSLKYSTTQSFCRLFSGRSFFVYMVTSSWSLPCAVFHLTHLNRAPLYMLHIISAGSIGVVVWMCWFVSSPEALEEIMFTGCILLSIYLSIPIYNCLYLCFKNVKGFDETKEVYVLYVVMYALLQGGSYYTFLVFFFFNCLIRGFLFCMLSSIISVFVLFVSDLMYALLPPLHMTLIEMYSFSSSTPFSTLIVCGISHLSIVLCVFLHVLCYKLLPVAFKHKNKLMPDILLLFYSVIIVCVHTYWYIIPLL